MTARVVPGPPGNLGRYPQRKFLCRCMLWRGNPLCRAQRTWQGGTAPGAEMRRLLGLAVFSGMLGVTLFGIFLTPVFFYVLQWLGGRRGTGQPASGPGALPAGSTPSH